MTNQKYWTFDKKTKIINHTELTAQIRAGAAQIPRSALTVPPLAEKSGCAVIALVNDDGKAIGTEYAADNRGQIIYNTADAEQKKTISELGEIEAGWTLEKPLPFSLWEDNHWVQQLDLLQDARHSDVNRWRDDQESNSDRLVVVDNINWNADPTSRDRITSTLQGDFIPPFWTDADNADQSITREKLLAVHTAIVQFGFSIHARQREMKTEIKALTTIDAVNNYLIGWPE